EERIARATLEQALAEQKKTEELREQLIGIVGHDLRSPLSSVIIGAELMLKRGMLHDADAKVTARIARSAERMAKIISQLLDFTRSRLGAGMRIEPRPADLAEIPAEVLPAIFDPFRGQARRASRNSDGLGLGLFICRELVAAHRGEISVQSTEEAGTTFTVRLPRQP